MTPSDRTADSDFVELRERLVGQLRAAGRLQSERLADAFRTVPRHVFVPGVDPERAYQDEAHPTKWGADGRPISSSSQPAIMAIMLEQLAVQPGHRVLEIGAGTGYNAALLAHLVGDAGSVVTVDIDEDLVASAREHLARCGLSRVTVAQGDGGFGWAPAAPYDRIILTVGASDLAPAWIEQLAPGGRLVLPLSLRGIQRSIAFEPVGDHLESRSSRYCGFMSLRGAFAGAETVVALGDGPGLFVEIPQEHSVDAESLHAALMQPGADVVTETRVTAADLWDGVALWLALHEPDIARIYAFEGAPEHGLVPPLIALPTQVFAAALLGERSLAALVRCQSEDTESFELAARPFGPDGEQFADRLASHVRAWDAANRPSTTDLHVRAYPRRAPAPPQGTVTITLPHTRLALEWEPKRRPQTAGSGSRLILHITTRAAWETARAAGTYEPASLASDGFIHLSDVDQVIRVANAAFSGHRDLVLLCVATDRLTATVKYESSHEDPERFPHLYGALNLDAVTHALPLIEGPEGYRLPPELQTPGEASR